MAIKDLKLKIINEAYKMLSEEGEENFSIRNLSSRLNISHNALYRHFSSKADLLYTILQIGFDEITAGFRQIFSNGMPVKEQLKEGAYYYIEFAVKNPNVYRIMQRIEDNPPQEFLRAYSENYMEIYQVFDRLVKDGTIKHATANSLVNTSWAFLHGIIHMLIDNILSMQKNLDSFPTQLQKKKMPVLKDLRKVLKFSIDLYINSLFEIKE